MGWMVWGSKAGGIDIFCTHPDQQQSPPRLVHKEYQVFAGVKGLVSGVDHQSPSSAQGMDG
jgi:hypothetical protein